MQLTKLIFPKTYLFVFLNAHRFVLWIMHVAVVTRRWRIAAWLLRHLPESLYLKM